MTGPRNLIAGLLEDGALSIRFQPIFLVESGDIRFHSFECLSRGPKGSNFERPDVLFEYARRKGAEGPVDRKCIETALRAARGLSPGSPVHLNVHASTMVRDPGFTGFLAWEAEAGGFPLNQLIIEILEHSPMGANPAFLERVRSLREIGVKIALDDIGAGDSNFKMILDLRPDYYKVDRYFVSGASRDPYRLAILASIADLSRKLGGVVIAEGVEHVDDLEACRASGINLVQGYLLSPPLTGKGLLRLIENRNEAFLRDEISG